MKPETSHYLDKARQALSEAIAVAGIELAEAAGRAAYLAVFHAAQALIFERSGKGAQNAPRGSRPIFSAGDKRAADRRPAPVPVPGVRLKTVADYEIGPDATVPLAEAKSAIETAQRFIFRIVELLG